MVLDERPEAAPTSGTLGLALSLGRLEERVRSLERDLAECQRQLTASRTDIRKVDTARVETTNRHVDRLNDHERRVAALEAKPATTPQTAPAVNVATMPTRRANEANADYAKRLATWATDNKKSAPPKPGAVMTAADYNRRVREWAATKG